MRYRTRRPAVRRSAPRAAAAAVLAAAAAAGWVLAPAAAPVRADNTSTFSFVAGDVSPNAAATFANTGTGITGALTIDPNNPDTLWIVNRNSPPTGGANPYSLSAQSRITNSAGAIHIGADAVMTWTSTADPYDVTVGTDGSLYVLFDNSPPGLYRISNPLSDAPSTTQLFGNYNGSGDDDPSFVTRMPANFGLANYTAGDLLMLDSGLDADKVTAVVAVHADASDGNSPLVVWQKSGASSSTVRGDVDPRTGYLYFINTAPESNNINGSDYLSLYRVKGDGVLQTLGLKLPAGAALSGLDDAIAVNPADGSVWIVNIDAGSNRTVYRVDTANLADEGGDQFLASVTTEFTATGFNLGVNSMTFSPDGTTLYGGTPDNTDTVYAFTTLVHNPGDANGDGKLDADDYALLDRGYADHLAGWTHGDFNVDGAVDAADYLILDTAFALAHGGLLSPALLAQRQAEFGDAYVAQLVAAVPEPASLSLLAVGALLPLARRRRRRSSWNP